MAAEGEVTPNWAFLGACIRRDRKARRWTQEDLAVHAGLALRTIGKYERGEGGSAGEGVPSGYFAVGRALDWRHGAVEERLFGPGPTRAPSAAQAPNGGPYAAAPGGPRDETPAAPLPPDSRRDPLVAAYRGVQDFLVLAVEHGAPAPLIRTFADAAGDLLEVVAADGFLGNALGLAANSPTGAAPAGDDAVRALAATADLPDVPGGAGVQDRR